MAPTLGPLVAAWALGFTAVFVVLVGGQRVLARAGLTAWLGLIWLARLGLVRLWVTRLLLHLVSPVNVQP